MRIDQGSASGEGVASDDPGVAGDSLIFINFVVSGHDYILVKYSDWIREQDSRPPSRERARPVVGRILIDGERHVILDAPSAPEPEGENPRLQLGDLLTQRELQVALLVAEGNCDKQIARKLGISGYTVREHIRRTFAKLNVSRRAAIVTHVLKHMREPIDALDPDAR